MNDAIRALVGIHLSRLRRSLVASVVMVVVMAGLQVMRKGWSVDTTLPWLLGAYVMLPLAPVLSLVREKMDGSLRYFASLPVSGRDHAISRTIVAMLVSIPGAAITAILFYLKLPGIGVTVAAFVFLAGAFLLTAGQLALLALQYKAETGRSMTYAVYGTLGMIGTAQVLWLLDRFEFFRRIEAGVLTPAGLSILSVLLWISMAAIAWFSFNSLAKSTVSYREQFTEP